MLEVGKRPFKWISKAYQTNTKWNSGGLLKIRPEKVAGKQADSNKRKREIQPMKNKQSKNLKRIPQELKDLPQWVGWKGEKNPKNPKKLKKIPIDPKTGRFASVTNPQTWGSYDDAIKLLKNGSVDGIGFVFTENDPYVGIDLDNCINKKTGEINPKAQKIIDSFGSYTEVSPSGKGVHIIVKGNLPGKGKNADNVEIYNKSRYFTVTGMEI
jgi:putative DNA primase/helicase